MSKVSSAASRYRCKGETASMGPQPYRCGAAGPLQGNPATIHEQGCSMGLMGSHARADARLQRPSIATALAVFVAALATVIGSGLAGAAPRITLLGPGAPAPPSPPATRR